METQAQYLVYHTAYFDENQPEIVNNLNFCGLWFLFLQDSVIPQQLHPSAAQRKGFQGPGSRGSHRARSPWIPARIASRNRAFRSVCPIAFPSFRFPAGLPRVVCLYSIIKPYKRPCEIFSGCFAFFLQFDLSHAKMETKLRRAKGPCFEAGRSLGEAAP